jgi:hypothetical protein
MKRLCRILIGWRDDIELDKRWWHRLAKVICVLALLLVAGLIYLIAADRSIAPTPDNIEIRHELIQFLETDWFVQNAGNDVNTFELFEKNARYPLGIIRRTEGTVLPPSKTFSSDTEQLYCSNKADIKAGGFRASDDSVVKNEKGEWTLDSTKGLVWRPIQNRPGEARDSLMWCYALAGTDNYTAKDVVAYELKRSAKALYHIGAAGSAVGIAVLAWLAFGNLYYRAVVFVICGPRKKSPAPVPSDV